MDAQIYLLSLGCQSACFPGSFLIALPLVSFMNGAQRVKPRVFLRFSLGLLIPPQTIALFPAVTKALNIYQWNQNAILSTIKSTLCLPATAPAPADTGVPVTDVCMMGTSSQIHSVSHLYAIVSYTGPTVV